MKPSPRWNERQLEADRVRAVDRFRKERMREPLEAYLRAFDEYVHSLDLLLKGSKDLLRLDDEAISILTDKRLFEAFRYLSGPPISEDDLRTLADAVFSPARLRADPKIARRVVAVVCAGLDTRRFPWVIEKRPPSRSERHAAVLASAALLANSRVGAARRNEGKTAQELLVEQALLAGGFAKVQTRQVENFDESPRAGEFCRESRLGTRKADFIVGLWDRRIMAIECKVSNSAVNSVKRLNNDAAAKAEAWVRDFGRKQTVPAAVLSGVFDLRNLLDAQDRGLALFWAHDLDAMLSWMKGTRTR
jgi:hypothetical protein